MSQMLKNIHIKIKQKNNNDAQKGDTSYLKNVAVILPIDKPINNLDEIINTLNDQQRELLLPGNKVIYRLEVFILNLTNESLDLGELDRKDSVKLNIINYNQEKYGLAMIKSLHHLLDTVLPDLVLTIDTNLLK